jgi:molecular chaperone GrpE
MAGDPAVKPSEKEVETAAAVFTQPPSASADSSGSDGEAQACEVVGEVPAPDAHGDGAQAGAGDAAGEAQAGAGEPQAADGDAAGEAEGPAGDGDAEGAQADGGDRCESEALGETDVAALAEKAAKADEYLELAQRTRADFENYRRRAARDAAAAQERGVAKLAKELLAAVDNLDRALAAAEAQAAAARSGEEVDGPGACEQLLSGIRLVHADVLAAFARLGIEPFSPVGERFDPQLHEAVAQQPCEGAESGTVIEVYQLGYRLGDGVLRPARVLVAA